MSITFFKIWTVNRLLYFTRLIVGFCLLIFINLLNPDSVGMAQTSDWSTPERISQEGGFAYSPFIVADSHGNLHVAWSENVSDPYTEDLNLDTIYYTSHSADGWSVPLDIFVAPVSGQAWTNRLRIDNADRLHLLYVTRPGMVYATVPADQAANVRSWKTYNIAENVYIADLAVTPDGILHIIYVTDRQGIYYIKSSDGGESWTPPVTVYAMPSDNYSSGSVRIEIGERGTFHVAYSVNSGELQWTPAWISYAQSTDGGSTWHSSLTVEEKDNSQRESFQVFEEVLYGLLWV